MLSDFIDWFDVDRLTAVIGVGAFFASFLFWWPAYRLTRTQHRASEAARRESLEPLVVVDISPDRDDRSILVFTAKNIGPSIARDVKISMDPPPTRSFDGPNDTPMADWYIFKNGIPAMPPGYQIQFFFDVGHRRFAADAERVFKVTVESRGPFGAVPTLEYILDLNIMREAWAGRTMKARTVKELAGISSALGGLKREIRALNPDERRVQREEIAAIRAEQARHVQEAEEATEAESSTS